MSDIEEENMLTFRTGIGEISVGGFSRNSNSKMITSMNNIKTNSNRNMMDLPQNDFRSVYGDRALSPLSLRSDVRPPRLHPGQYASSQRSIVDGRSRSPMSFRSVDTTKSVVDITNALKYETFNTHELQMIKEVVCRKLKLKLRKKYEKNRQKSVLIKSNRNNLVRNIRCTNNSDRDSSLSPISSNEYDQPGSLKNTSLFKKPHNSQINKSFLMNSINNNDQYIHKKNVFSINQRASKNLAEVVKPDSTQTCNEGQTLKDLFTNEYMFPSQRFSNTTECEKNSYDIPKVIVSEVNHSSENEEIFPDNENRKRSLNNQFNNNAKRIKLASPPIEVNNAINYEQNCLIDTFKKPLMPKPKQNNIALKQTVISKSVPSMIPVDNITEEPTDVQNACDESKLAEVSMKSSFSKRKLFTQKADLFISKGFSDTAGPSPQTKVDIKDRNKARKLVTMQSCLNRTVSDEEDNVLDLIHKIVPAEQINATSSNINKTNTVPDDKMDSDISDTFTDETLNGTVFDINPEQNNIDKGENGKLARSLMPKGSRVLICNALPQNCGSKSMFQRSNFIKSFWETDIESEMESENIPVWKIPRSIANRDHFKDVTLSALNTTTQQVGKNRANILTVQDLKNKIVNSKKRSNTVIEIEEPMTNEQEQTLKIVIPKVVINNKINNLNQLEPDKTVKEKKKTIASRSKNKKQNTQEDYVSNNKQGRRTKNSYKNCSGCEDLTTKTQNSKANAKNSKTKESGRTPKAKAAEINSSFDTSNNLNISSRTRSKQGHKSVETSKENISQLSDNIHNSISIKSLRPRKMKNKNDTF